jgi:hypothetical protein
MKNSKDTIGNRSRDLPFCSAVPQPPRHRVPPFSREYPVLSLRLSNGFLRLLPRLSVTSITRFIFPSITCRRRQFLHKMWPIKLAFRLLISCRIFLCSLTQSNTVILRFLHDRSNWSSPSFSSITFQKLNVKNIGTNCTQFCKSRESPPPPSPVTPKFRRCWILMEYSFG